MSLFLMYFPFLYILSSSQSFLTVYMYFAKFVCLLKRLLRLIRNGRTVSWYQANIWQNLGLIGQIERKLANYQRLLLLTVLPLNYFMTVTVTLRLEPQTLRFSAMLL